MNKRNSIKIKNLRKYLKIKNLMKKKNFNIFYKILMNLNTKQKLKKIMQNLAIKKMILHTKKALTIFI